MAKKKVKRKKKAPVRRVAKKRKASSVSLSSLKAHPKNPMDHSEEKIQKLVKSLEEFGQARSIVVWKNLCIAGNRTMQAAKRLGWSSIIAVIADDLTEEQAMQYMIMDNVSSDEHVYDDGKITSLLKTIKRKGGDLSFSGLNTMRINRLMNPEEAPEEFENLDALDTAHRCPKCGYEWDGKE